MTECIIHPNRPGRDGYVWQQIDGVSKSVHRREWESHNGPIPEGMVVMHSCDNRPCCNIEHLSLGTLKENSADMVAKGRHRGQAKTHCPHGHEYTEENTYRQNGRRSCRSCRNGKRPQCRKR